MEQRFVTSKGTAVVVRLATEVDVSGRVAQYQLGRGHVSEAEQQRVEIYAEATYLKYRSARDDFGATVGSIPELKARMAAAESESLLLLEGERTDTGELVGALLLRVAWSGDLVVDFVGTNFAATKMGTPRLENAGLMLVYTALLVGRQINAPLIYAETARHSAAWWGKFLLAGDNLIKVDDVEATWRRLHEFLEKAGKMTIVSSV